VNIFCRIGIHRDLVHEERHYVRDITDAGETVDAHENKTCRCGAVIETKKSQRARINDHYYGGIRKCFATRLEPQQQQ